MEKNKNQVKNAENAENQVPKKDLVPDQGQQQEPEKITVKQNFIDRQYAKYCTRREARLKKKADKKPLSKKEKAGLIAGGTVIAGAVLGGIAKAAIMRAANAEYVDGGDEDTYLLGDGDVQIDAGCDSETDSSIEAGT